MTTPDYHTAYIGYTTCPRLGAERFIADVSAPSNYKDPEKILAYKQAAHERAMYNAADKPLTGQFANVAVLTRGPGTDVLNVVPTDWPNNPVLSTLHTFKRIFVLDMARFFRLARAECIDKAGGMSEQFWWATPNGIDRILHGTMVGPYMINPMYEVTDSHDEDTSLEVFKLRYPQVVPRFDGKADISQALYNAHLTANIARLIGA